MQKHMKVYQIVYQKQKEVYKFDLIDESVSMSADG